MPDVNALKRKSDLSLQEGGFSDWAGTTTYEPEAVPEPIWNAPATSSDYEAAMTVPVGTDPLSLQTDQALGGIYDSGGQGPLFNEAQGLVSGLLGTGGDIGGYDPQTEAGQAARAGLTDLITGRGLDPAEFRTGLGTDVQGRLSDVIGQQGVRPAHEAVQQAQQQYDALIQQGAQRPLSASEQAMLQQLQQTIANQGQLGESDMAASAGQSIQGMFQRGGAPVQSDIGSAAQQGMANVLGEGGGTYQTGIGARTEGQIQDVQQQGGRTFQGAMGGQVNQQIADLLANQGRLPPDMQREAMQIEAARSPLDVMRRAQTAQGAAALADRGLVGSGAGREYLEGLEERLAPQYTQAAQQIEEQRRRADEQRFSQALGLGADRAGQQERARQQSFEGALGLGAQTGAQQAARKQQSFEGAMGMGAQRGGQLEQMQQQGEQYAASEAHRQATQQEELEQGERQFAMGQAGQYGLGLAQQGQQQQQFAISGQQQLGTQQDQMRDTRLGEAMELGGQLSAQEAAANQESYIQSVMAGEGITRDEAMAADQRMQFAVQQATGMDAQRVQTLLSTAKTVGDRQAMLSDIALRSLDQNQDWHRFLAEFGLQREQVMEAMQMGRANAVVQLLDLYARTGQTTSTGYVPYDKDIE